jgi:hypothetical protein
MGYSQVEALKLPVRFGLLSSAYYPSSISLCAQPPWVLGRTNQPATKRQVSRSHTRKSKISPSWGGLLNCGMRDDAPAKNRPSSPDHGTYCLHGISVLLRIGTRNPHFVNSQLPANALLET